MPGNGKQKFAVFDIDGTLIRWQLYHAIVDSLARAGYIAPERHKAARKARMEWKERLSDNSFHEYELFMINSYDQALTNINPENFKQAVERVFAEYRNQTYTYTRDLIKSLKLDGYLLFAISASQLEIVEMLAKYYGFDDWGGSTYEVKDGKFTGKKYVLKSEQKPLHLQKLIREHNTTMDGSIGVGDSEGDIAMLETVEKPIAFNPTEKLFAHAKQKGWEVVVERKNMVYKLEPTDGLYVLE